MEEQENDRRAQADKMIRALPANEVQAEGIGRPIVAGNTTSAILLDGQTLRHPLRLPPLPRL